MLIKLPTTFREANSPPRSGALDLIGMLARFVAPGCDIAAHFAEHITFANIVVWLAGQGVPARLLAYEILQSSHGYRNRLDEELLKQGILHLLRVADMSALVYLDERTSQPDFLYGRREPGLLVSWGRSQTDASYAFCSSSLEPGLTRCLLWCSILDAGITDALAIERIVATSDPITPPTWDMAGRKVAHL